jgi:hypothetical protein
MRISSSLRRAGLTVTARASVSWIVLAPVGVRSTCAFYHCLPNFSVPHTYS